MLKLKVGYLPLIKGSWVNDKLERQRIASRQALEKLENIELVDTGKLIQTEAEGAEALELFYEKRVDVVVAHFVTFSLGGIVPGIAARLRVPVLFWSEPEPPMQGGRIAANSFCASNMNAHALWKMNLKYALVYGHIAEAVPQFASRFRVMSCLKKLQSTRIGSLGGRVPGFYTSNFDELALREKFGTEVETVTLLELVKLAEGIEKKETSASAEAMTKGCACATLSDDEKVKGGALLAAFRKLAENKRLNAWAVRCWPEFSDLYGIGVCHLLGCLTGSGLPAACEGDVYGALAMLIVESLTGQPAFFCDLISFDPQGDTSVFWHCGAAPLAWCKSGCQPKLGKHSIIDGGGVKGIASEFPLEAKDVTVIRIGDRREGGFRLLSLRGEGQDTAQLLKGNPLTVKFRKNAGEVTDELLASGFEHHYVMARGDISKELKYLAELLDLQLLEI
jgi:L-fucose isomerase-like protein